MELFHKLCAVVLGDTCKLHRIKEDLPGTVVTLPCSPLFQSILNSFFLITWVILVAEINHFSVKTKELQDGLASASSLSAGILPEEHSISPTSCKGDKRWHYWANPVIWAQHPTHNSEVVFVVLHWTQHKHTCSLTVHWLWEDRVPPVSESYLRHALDNLPLTCTQQMSKVGMVTDDISPTYQIIRHTLSIHVCDVYHWMQCSSISRETWWSYLTILQVHLPRRHSKSYTCHPF